MSLILSHTTALQYHRAPLRPPAGEAYPHVTCPLKSGVPQAEDVEEARRLLTSWGVPEHFVETIEILVSAKSERRRLPGVRCHVCGMALPAASLIRLAPNVFVVDARLCALQAARHLNRLELVELYYELCGAYEMPLIEGGAYRERPVLTSTARLVDFFTALNRVPGCGNARWAVRYVRDGARSPMESATVMTVVLPKKYGGLGIKGLAMDYPIPVRGPARRMTRRSTFYADAYIESARLLLEYMGMGHEEEHRQVSDSERENALGAMGYSVVSIWRGALFDRDNYRRILARIRERVGLRPQRFPEDFDDRQEALRQFVVRRWVKAQAQAPARAQGGSPLIGARER